MTKAQEVYERIEALVGGGTKKAEAFRQMAEETGRPVKSLQGAYYQHTRQTGTTGKRRSRRIETTPADAFEQAKAVLVRAMDDIDAEITAAQERADEATAEYEALKNSAESRKEAIAAKLEALG